MIESSLQSRQPIETRLTNDGYALLADKVLVKRKGVNTIVFVPNFPAPAHTFYQAQALGEGLTDTSDKVGTVEQMKEREERYINLEN